MATNISSDASDDRTVRERTAIVTGASGQDGWYLTRLLARKGYRVHAQTRGPVELEDEFSNITYHVGDVRDDRFLARLLTDVRPSEVYNLAAVSRPSVSWDRWKEVFEVNALFPHSLCELIRFIVPEAKLFQASSSEMFGTGRPLVQTEKTACFPDNPYGASKEYAHRIVGAYRAHYGLHFSAGILFNHESPRRPLSFVSQKIAHGVALLAMGRSDSTECDENGRPILQEGKLNLGNIATRRDFGFAGDYAEAMFAILQHQTPDDFVIGTGKAHSIAEFCKFCFQAAGLDWREHVVSREDLLRSSDQDSCADPAKLREEVGWQAETDIQELSKIMVSARMALLQQRVA